MNVLHIDFLQLLTTIVVLIVSFLICLKLGVAFFRLSTKRVIKLFLWHFIFCLIYIFYVTNVGGDANGYFSRANAGLVNFNVGTRFVDWLTSILINLNLSFVGVFFFFNCLGTIGLLAFDSTLKSIPSHSKKFTSLKTFLPFLPSISFWSAGLGKDAISFLAISLAIWSITRLRKKNSILVISIIIMLLVRPHIAAIMVVALCTSIAFERGVKLPIKVLVLLISLLGTSLILPFALKYSGVSSYGGLNSESIQTYIDKRQSYNLEGGSSVNIDSMSLPMQMFTYLFRPFPFEARSITSLFASLDNMVLFMIIIIGLKSIFHKNLKYDFANRKFLWVYSLLTLVILSMTTANLGIAMRQKWMFVPVIMYLFLSAISVSKIRRNSKSTL